MDPTVSGSAYQALPGLGLRGGDPGADGMRTSSAPILPQAFLAACHHRRREQTAYTAAHHGGGRAEELSRNPGFQLAELRSAHEEDHVDPGHPAAQLVGCFELSDDVANHGADRVRSAHGREA